jgi:hypothetical protein
MSYNNVCGDDSSVCVGLPVDIQGKFNKNNPVGCKATSCKNCQGCVANELSNTGTTIPLAVTTCPTNKAFCDGLFVESDYCTVEEKEEACFNYCPKNDDCNFPLPMPSAMCEENNSSGACRDPEKTINGFLYTEGKYVCCGISSISDQQTEQCNPSCEGCLGCSETNMLGSCQKNQYVCGVKKPWNCGVSLDKTGKITSSQYDTMYVAPACVESMLSLNANCIKAEYISTELKPQVNSSVNNLLCPSGFFFLSSDFLCKNQALVTQYCSNTPTESSILNTTVCGYLNPYCSTGIIQSGVCSEFSEGGPSRPIIYAITGSTLVVSGVALGLGYYFQKTKKYKQALFASAVFFTSAVVGIIPIFL